MLDYDPPKDGTAALTREQLTDILHKSLGLEYLSHVWWPSTSSCIYHGEEQITGIKGQRFYYFVRDACDLERAAKVINDKLWAHGYGHYEVSKSGALLEKGLFDTSVWQPSRIDFAAGAKCQAPLRQMRGDPQLHEGLLDDVLDTATLFASLSPEERAAADHHKLLAKEKRSAEAAMTREQWAKECGRELKKSHPQIQDTQIQAVITRAVERQQLLGDWLLTIVERGVEAQVSVATVLANPDRFHGAKTLDPLEPDYDGRRVVGKLFLKGAKPKLHSFAHGGATYTLQGELVSIELISGQEHVAVDKLLEVLRNAPDIFEYGSELVTVVKAGELMPLNEHALRYFVGGIVQFVAFKKTRNELVRYLIDPPGPVLKSILGLGSLRNLKRISAVISAPTLRPDGTLLDQPGYDAQTEILYEPSGSVWAIPQTPNQEQAQQALATLWKPFESFPFEAQIDKAVLLAGLLTAAIRPGLPTSPAIGFDAPVQGSGKTLLAKCLGVLASGEEPAVWPHTAGRNDEEVRKRLFAALRSGKTALIWDNVIGAFDSMSMAALLTSTVYTDRILSESKVSTIPNRTLLLLTGNNLTLKGDMARRVLVARIDPNTDKPFARNFALDPYRYCLHHRQRLISCALTLIRFYLTAKDKQPGGGRTASFEDWDDMVRQTVVHINQTIAPNQFGDVMEKMTANQSEDPEQEALNEFLTAWDRLFGEKAVTAAQVIGKLSESHMGDPTSPEQTMLRAVATLNPNFKNSTKSIGSFLKYRKGRIINGRKLITPGYRDGSALWSVITTNPDEKKRGKARGPKGFEGSADFVFLPDILQ